MGKGTLAEAIGDETEHGGGGGAERRERPLREKSR
jgi:hypothetical protein